MVNEAIGEATLPLQRFFHSAFRTKAKVS